MVEVRWGEERPLWKRLILNPRIKWILLVPAALSALATMDDVGEIAARIVILWQPTFDWTAQLLASALPRFASPHGMAVTFFFLPFVIYGFVATIVLGRGEKLGPPGVLLSFAAMWALGYFVSGASERSRGDVLDWLGGAADRVAWSCAFYAFWRLALAVRWRGVRSQLAALCLASATYQVWYLSAYSPWAWQASQTAALSYVLAQSLPLLAPKRLQQAVLMVLVLLGISLTHLWVTNSLVKASSA